MIRKVLVCSVLLSIALIHFPNAIVAQDDVQSNVSGTFVCEIERFDDAESVEIQDFDQQYGGPVVFTADGQTFLIKIYLGDEIRKWLSDGPVLLAFDTVRGTAIPIKVWQSCGVSVTESESDTWVVRIEKTNSPQQLFGLVLGARTSVRFVLRITAFRVRYYDSKTSVSVAAYQPMAIARNVTLPSNVCYPPDAPWCRRSRRLRRARFQ
ncbi:MAG: hypothetical protein ACK5UC_16130 [Planctomycetaceae bacterium]|jgi:hypothetical protein